MTTITITRYHGPQPDGWDQFLAALPHHVAHALMIWRRDEEPETAEVVLDCQGVHTDRRIDLLIDVNWPGSDTSIRAMCEQAIRRSTGEYLQTCGLEATVRLARPARTSVWSLPAQTFLAAQDLAACFQPHAVAAPGYGLRGLEETPSGKGGTTVIDQFYDFLAPPPEDDQDRFNRQIRAWRGDIGLVGWQ